MSIKAHVCILALASVACAGQVAAKTVTEKEVLKAEQQWGDGIVAIGKAYSKHKDYKALAKKHVDTLYGYDEGTVLFKPTKASAKEFRPTEPEAVSYFVGGVVPEDHGFAIQPWSKVRFENAGIITGDDYAISMGNYYFTDAETGKEVKADFTFAYKRADNGKLLIDVHHSSFPFEPAH